MALSPTFNGFSLQSSSIITKTINFRTRAKKKIDLKEISRRIGKKMVNSQAQEKVIEISGVIIGDNPSDLTDKIDEFHKELSREEKSLIIEGSRSFTATAESIVIPDRSYNQSFVEFSVSFVCAEGFAKDNQVSATYVLTSGNLSGTIATTVSGNVLTRPLFRFALPNGTGTAPISKFVITNNDTGNTLTVSGTWNYGDIISVDFDNFQITRNGSATDYLGAMDDINPGSNSFGVTVSGSNDGTNITLEYNPRYW